MTAPDLIGRVVAFFPKADAVKRGVRQPGTVRYVGQIIAATDAPPVGKGKVPDFTLTVRGKTGKTATISMTLNYATLHDTWKSASLDT
jgi:hypothetical protein